MVVVVGAGVFHEFADRGGAGVTVPRFDAFSNGEGSAHKGGKRIGPGPSERGVRDEAEQDRRREQRADQGLLGISHHSGGAEFSTGAPL